MIGLALSGGGSRAMAFHLGCLRALDDLGILNEISIISTISGGSLIGAYYAYNPQKSFNEFESDIRKYLHAGYQWEIFLELIQPHHFFQCLSSFSISYTQEISSLFIKTKRIIQRYPTRTDMFYKVLQKKMFQNLTMKSPRRNNIEIVIGACELRTGSAFRFGNLKSGSWRHGELIVNDIDLAFAVASSAAYPLLLPSFDRTFKFQKQGKIEEHRVLLTDGGVYDNLGIQVLEPLRNLQFSLHSFPCDYLIICNAGHGQSSGINLPVSFLRRIGASFGIVHRRMQDVEIHNLYNLKKSGLIKSFILPYLGQIDDRLPWRPGILVPREEVIKYNTNFASMSEEWIDKLSNRGEQLTRILASYYLRELL